MSDVRSLVYAINKFLRSEISEGQLPEEKVEGVEICIQCLETAYEIGPSEPTLDVAFALQDMFQKFVSENEPFRDPTAEEKAAADTLKNEGNCMMDLSCFEDAVLCYTKAIKLDPTNPKYYCNRAAALNNLENYDGAIKDSEMALRYDPYYGKAYFRLGTAHSKLNQNWPEAVRNYKRAVELEPHNEKFKACLKAAETSMSARNTRAGGSRQGVQWNGSLDYLMDLLLNEQLGQDEGNLARQMRNPILRSEGPTSDQPNSNEPPF